MATTKTATKTYSDAQKLAALAAIDNATLVNALRASDPNFANITAEATAETFTERGYTQMAAGSMERLNNLYGLLMRVFLQEINFSNARDPLADADIGESFDKPRGGITQRIAMQTIKPCDPAYMTLTNGQSVDPFIVSLPEQSERFFESNFNYQSMVTLQNFPMKQIFLEDFGISRFTAGVMQGLLNGWTLQKYANKMETINAAINDPTLKSTQNIATAVNGEWTAENLVPFINTIMDVIDEMTESAQTSAFNMLGHEDIQDRSRLRLLVRTGFKNALKTKTLLGAFNPDELNLGIPVKQTINFGGIKYQTAEGAPLYIARDQLGRAIGLTATEKGEKQYDFNSPDVVAIDPNEDVIAVLMDKGFIFEEWQNGYVVDPIHNPRGMYDNYFCNAPANAIHYDRLYNFVVFRKASTQA